MDNRTVIETLAARLNIPAKEVKPLVAALSASLRNHCGDTDSVAIPGFGTFAGIKEDEKISTDISTGEHILFPPHIAIEFIPSSNLRKIASSAASL